MATEDYVDKVDLRQVVKFQFNALPIEQRLAKISRFANSLCNMRQEIVEVEIPLKSGATWLLVPNSAIVRFTERKYVVEVEKSRATLVDVKEGMKGQRFLVPLELGQRLSCLRTMKSKAVRGYNTLPSGLPPTRQLFLLVR